MTQTKKLVYGGKRGLDKAVENHKAKGWEVDRTNTIPRGNTGKMIYIAELKRDKR